MNTTMNTVNQTFDWSRFTATLRKELVENKRAILFTLLGTYGLLTMFMIFGNLSVYDNPEDALSAFAPQKMVWFILSFASMIVASMAFRKLTNKTGRIEMFTSPSSMVEKFLVNALIYVIGYLVAFFICTQLADLTRIAVLWPFRGDDMIVPGPINFLTAIPDAVEGMGFGSAAPGKPSTWLTTIMILAANISDMEAVGDWVMDHLEHIMMAMTIISALLTILYWSLSWYLFKRKDVVSLKWWK